MIITDVTKEVLVLLFLKMCVFPLRCVRGQLEKGRGLIHDAAARCMAAYITAYITASISAKQQCNFLTPYFSPYPIT